MFKRKERKEDPFPVSEKQTSTWKLLLGVWQEFFLSLMTLIAFFIGGYWGLSSVMAACALFFFFIFVECTPVRPLWSLFAIQIMLFFSLAIFIKEPIESGTTLLLVFIPGLYACWRRRYPKKIFRILNDFSQDAIRQVSLESISFSSLTHLAEMDRYKNAYIQLWDKEKDEMVLVAGNPVYENGLRFQRGRGVGWRCFQSGRAVLIMDTSRDLDYIPSPFSARSCVLLPLVVGGRRFGVLGVESRSLRRFNSRDVEVLSLFAAFVSFALQAVEMQQGMTQAVRQQKSVLKEKDAAIASLRKMMETAVWLDSAAAVKLQETNRVCDNTQD